MTSNDAPGKMTVLSFPWHDEQRCTWENDGIELSLEDGADGNKFWWKAGDNLVVPINYVHQLQDAMRLAMADKVIEL